MSSAYMSGQTLSSEKASGKREFRRAHMLKPNARGERPDRILFFDVESRLVPTRDGMTRHDLKLGWGCSWHRSHGKAAGVEVWHEFTTVKEFWDWVESETRPHKRLLMVAHNISFDMVVCNGFETLHGRGWVFDKLFYEGRVNIWHCMREKRSILFLDNLNFFQCSLADLGGQIGVDKGQIEFETADEHELSTYCRRDVEVLLMAWRWWLDILTRYDLGNFAPTAAGQAFAAFRHKHMKEAVFLHDRPLVCELEREAYTGGRVECFRVGVQPKSEYVKFDINSMYPFVMREREFPIALKLHINYPSVRQLGQLLSKGACVARVVIETDMPYYPLHLKGQLLFPIGRFTTSLASPELLLALRNGHIVEVETCAAYRSAPLFKSYVDNLYALRQLLKTEGKLAQSYMVKLLLNSLYGKFGQHGHETIENGPGPDRGMATWTEYDSAHVAHKMVSVYGREYEDVVSGETWNSFPAIAAHVTSYARVYLLEIIEAVGWSHVLYMDTDSLFLDAEGASALPPEYVDATRLGALKVEEITNRLEIWCPKDYSTDTHIVRKGISSHAIDLGSERFMQDHFPTLRGLLMRGNVTAYYTTKVVKRLLRVYLKGLVDQDGRVRPYVLPEEEALVPESLWLQP